MPPPKDLSVLSIGTPRNEVHRALGVPQEESVSPETDALTDEITFEHGWSRSEKARKLFVFWIFDFIYMGTVEAMPGPRAATVGVLVTYDDEERVASVCVYQGYTAVGKDLAIEPCRVGGWAQTSAEPNALEVPRFKGVHPHIRSEPPEGLMWIFASPYELEMPTPSFYWWWHVSPPPEAWVSEANSGRGKPTPPEVHRVTLSDPAVDRSCGSAQFVVVEPVHKAEPKTAVVSLTLKGPYPAAAVNFDRHLILGEEVDLSWYHQTGWPWADCEIGIAYGAVAESTSPLFEIRIITREHVERIAIEPPDPERPDPKN